MDEQFRNIFKTLPKKSFLEMPESILSFMRDLRIDRSTVRMLDTIIQLNRRRFLMVMTCPEEDVGKHVHLISDDCLLREEDVSELISSMRQALSERCRSIGIYLGNERSYLCYRDIDGELIKVDPISTAMFFDDDSIVIGGVALSMHLMDPDCFVQGFINELGKDTIYKIKGIDYSPTALSRLFIRRLLEDHFGECGPDIGHITIIIPPLSGKEGEDAVYQAGIEAGLDDIRVLSEAFSSSLAVDIADKASIIHLDEDGFAFTLMDRKLGMINNSDWKGFGIEKWRQELMGLILEKCPEIVVEDDVRLQLSLDIDGLMKTIDVQPKVRGNIRSGSQNIMYSVTREEYMSKVEGLFEMIREECLWCMAALRLPCDEYGSFLVVGDFPLKNMMASVFKKIIPLDLRFLSYESIILGAIMYDQK